MEENKTTFKDWCKEHKTELIIGGTVLVAAAGAVIGIKICCDKTIVQSAPKMNTVCNSSAPIVNTGSIITEVKTVIESTEVVKNAGSPKCSHERHWTTKRLPKGFHASLQAKAKAAELGITLEEGRTFVSASFIHPEAA